MQASVRKRLLRAFVARGHLESHDAKDINERAASSQHGGFPVDAGVRIEAVKRTVQLVPPQRTHGHRYYGVLAANSPLRGAVRLRA